MLKINLKNGKRVLHAVLPGLLLLLASCASTPELIFELGQTPAEDDGKREEKRIVSVAELKALYKGKTHLITEDVAIQAVILENNFYGAYTKTIVVGDQTGGIEILWDKDNEDCREELEYRYAKGFTMTVPCNGLVLDAPDGLLRMGTPVAEGEKAPGIIPQSEIPYRFLVTGTNLSEIPIKELSLGELAPKWLSCVVKIRDVQFVEEEVGLGYGIPLTKGSSNRHLVNRSGDTLLVRTRNMSEYAAFDLPTGSGFAEGILSRFRNTYQLIVNPRRVAMQWPRFEVVLPEEE